MLQLVDPLLAWKVPATQAKQPDAPSSDADPALQFTQVDGKAAPLAADALPAIHAVQLDKPAVVP